MVRTTTSLITPPTLYPTRTSVHNHISKKLSKKQTSIKWTESEYSSLVKLIKQYGEDWSHIASTFNNKTAKQCMQKFKNSQRSAKKGNWSPDEDELLLKWVEDCGPTKWTECSKLIQGRCGKQCRERWVNILNPYVKKGNWGDDEQNIIFESLSVHYTSWSSMSKVLSGRTENSIKNYFYSSLRRLKSNPLCDLIKEVYVDKSVDLKTVLQNQTFINGELAKLNTLSQRMCAYLLSDSLKDDNFAQFLVTVIFSENPPLKIIPSNKHINQSNANIISQTRLASIYIPQETNKQPLGSIQGCKENNARSVIAVLKQMVDEVRKPGLLGVINYLENHFGSNPAGGLVEKTDGNVMVRLPFCWNCKAKSCTTHNK